MKDQNNKGKKIFQLGKLSKSIKIKLIIIKINTLWV